MPKAEENDPSAPTPDIPDTNTDKITDKNDETKADNNSKDTTNDKSEDETEEKSKGGCGSSASLSALAIVALVGSALII